MPPMLHGILGAVLHPEAWKPSRSGKQGCWDRRLAGQRPTVHHLHTPSRGLCTLLCTSDILCFGIRPESLLSSCLCSGHREQSNHQKIKFWSAILGIIFCCKVFLWAFYRGDI